MSSGNDDGTGNGNGDGNGNDGWRFSLEWPGGVAPNAAAAARLRNAVRNSLRGSSEGANESQQHQRGQPAAGGRHRQIIFCRECSICMEAFEDGPQQALPCGHMFHRRCVGEWFGERFNCPICNFEIPANEVQLYCRDLRVNSSRCRPCP